MRIPATTAEPSLPIRRSDDVDLDINKAMGRFEADVRDLSSQSKKKRIGGSNPGRGKVGAGKAGGGRKGGKGK